MVVTGGVLAAAAGCSGGSGTSSGSAPPSRTLAPDPGGGGHLAAAWPTYGSDFARSGVADAANPGRLTVSWRAHLDGAVYGQPLLVGTIAIAATENDSIYGLDQATGKVIWRRHVGSPVPLADLPCGNIDPLGITGTPVYNPASGLVYAVAETSGYHHVLVGVSVRDGSVQVERDIPAPDGQPRYDQQRPALTIEHGRVYVAFGGLAGDCGPYRGSVVGVPLSGAGPLISYLVPTPREGAVWGTGGPVTGPDGYGAAAVAGSIVYEPCEQGGMAAIDTTGRRIHVLWHGPASAWGSPVVGGGAVWVTDWKTGTLYELDQATGMTRASLSLGTTLPHFSSMSMTGRHAFLGTMEGVVAVGGV